MPLRYMAILHTLTHTHAEFAHFTFHTWAASVARIASVLPPNWNASEFVAVHTVPHQLRAQIPNNDSTISSHTHTHAHIAYRTSLSWHCHCHYALKGLVAKFNFLHLNGFTANIHNCCNILWHPELHAQLLALLVALPVQCYCIDEASQRNEMFCKFTPPSFGNQFLLWAINFVSSPFNPPCRGNDYSIGIFSFHKLL